MRLLRTQYLLFLPTGGLVHEFEHVFVDYYNHTARNALFYDSSVIQHVSTNWKSILSYFPLLRDEFNESYGSQEFDRTQETKLDD